RLALGAAGRGDLSSGTGAGVCPARGRARAVRGKQFDASPRLRGRSFSSPPTIRRWHLEEKHPPCPLRRPDRLAPGFGRPGTGSFAAVLHWSAHPRLITPERLPAASEGAESAS